MSNISKDSLVTAFSALSVLTRNLVQEELEAALRDTAMEYHKTVRDTPECQKLVEESSALTFMIEASKQATQEFDSIVNSPESHDSSDD